MKKITCAGCGAQVVPGTDESCLQWRTILLVGIGKGLAWCPPCSERVDPNRMRWARTLGEVTGSFQGEPWVQTRVLARGGETSMSIEAAMALAKENWPES